MRRFNLSNSQCASFVIVFATVLVFGQLDAVGQTQDDLRQQLLELKQQYEKSMREFQQRMDALELQIERQGSQNPQQAAKTSEVSQPGTNAQQQKTPAVSTTELAQEVAKQIGSGEQNEAEYQGELPSEPTYDLLHEAEAKIEKLSEQVSSFEFHGYIRSGAGLNSQGGQMVAFQAPGASAKYRLGNEAETYGEWIFVDNWLNPDQLPGNAWFKTEVMFETNTTNSDTYANFPNSVGNDQFRLREAFVRAGNLFEAQPEAKFWAGERYYRRQHIEINDFYPLDMSGYGAGAEDLNMHFAKMAVAFLSAARPDTIIRAGTYAKSNIDVRLYDMKAPMGLWGFWFDFAAQRGGTTTTGLTIPSTNGCAGGIRLQKLEWHGGYNAALIQYGTGAASNFSSSIDTPTPFVRSTERLLIANHMLVQPNDKFAIMPIFLYQRTRDGNPLHGHTDWVSFGARPVVFFNRYVSLAFESGFDYTNGFNTTVNGPVDGWLRKFTIAPQLGAGRKFFSRPVLRTFFTYANWSNGFRGLVGGLPYQNKTNGISLGVQVETWW